jgi:biopolymer transport protein ExbB/TolQ
MATNLESSLHISDLILQASPVVQLVMLILLLASIFSWYLIAKLHMGLKKQLKMMSIFKNVLVRCRIKHALQ